jgi:hypothetical protein
MREAPGHVTCVRELVIDELTGAELAQLRALCDRIVAGVGASAWNQSPSRGICSACQVVASHNQTSC